VQAHSNDRRIDYVEFPATDIDKTKSFYGDVFGWRFTDYGSDYTSFEDGRLTGGFSKERRTIQGGVLIVIYARDLEATEASVRRFHFLDPNGNELAVWSE
jgi:predicted enzyme related to lactoylglutathione lyase